MPATHPTPPPESGEEEAEDFEGLRGGLVGEKWEKELMGGDYLERLVPFRAHGEEEGEVNEHIAPQMHPPFQARCGRRDGVWRWGIDLKPD